MARGTLRIYLGAAPGVGKTFAMLNEGWRRHERGTDVAIGFVETHGRDHTAAQVRGLEVVPRRNVQHRGAELTEMDVDAVLARHPDVVLVDELAHTNAPGSRHEKRWRDVEDLLDAGIDVISTVNIQHLESLNDVIERITGVTQRETVPDEVVRRADQIELVDMTPEALRRRMAHGNIYPPERVDAALANYFRPGNLGALRELALLWVADRVEESLQDYLEAHRIVDTWETRERVVVALTGAPGGEQLVRRAARMAARAKSDLVGVHVSAGDGLAHGTRGDGLEHQRRLLAELGGTFREVVGDDVATALASFARAEKATQLVLGASRRSRWRVLLGGDVTARILRQVHQVDVHVIATESMGETHLPSVQRPSALPRRRQVAAAVAGVVGLVLLTILLTSLRDQLTLSTALLAYLTVVLVVAAVGGLYVGLGAAIAAFLLVNWYFTPPLYELTVGEAEDVVALVVFVAVAATISVLVDRAARRAHEATRARAEAEALARSTAELVASPDPLPALLDQLRSTFSLDGVAVLEQHDGEWTARASAGDHVIARPADGVALPLDERETAQLVYVGPVLGPDDQRVLRAFADQLSVATERRRLLADAADADAIAQGDALRAALLQAVSHDLRTPLASIKASVTSLLQRDVAFSHEDQQQLLTNIDAATDRLDRLVGNLLDMSRLQSGALHLACRPVALEDVVASAVSGVEPRSRLDIDVPETLPLALADPALLERAVANVVSNALAWTPSSCPVRIEAAEVAGSLNLRVVDRGPGVPPAERDRVFEPFQRRGDRSNDAGVGLGLAIAKGFVGAMGGEVRLDDTPGGGLTVTIDLPMVGAT